MKKLIIANWKANPKTEKEAVALARAIEKKSKHKNGLEVIIAAPFIFLPALEKFLERFKLGAQDAFWEAGGPYTGEIGWGQLKALGVEYVLVGHSERRENLYEMDEIVNKKVRALLKGGMCPILCVGERIRTSKEIPALVGEQLRKALSGVSANQAKKLIVCYEPVWAISTSKNSRPDTPDTAFRAKIYLQKILADLFGVKLARGISVLYGGSVDSKNIKGFINEGKMDGALVGHASLDAEEFAKILNLV